MIFIETNTLHPKPKIPRQPESQNTHPIAAFPTLGLYYHH
jgi:hypothetical protein